MNYSIRYFYSDSADYKKTLELRYEVLRRPLGLEFTEKEMEQDQGDVHFGLFSGDEALACLTLTEYEGRKMKMRQVAVKTSHQRRGLGKLLSEAAEQYSRDKGFGLMFCHARREAVPFYQKMDYHIVGDEFTEVNIPHYRMEKSLH